MTTDSSDKESVHKCMYDKISINYKVDLKLSKN